MGCTKAVKESLVRKSGAMIAKSIERLRRGLWTWKQPLTHQPFEVSAPVSDLFVWRNSHEWKTYFELIDIPSLFDGGNVSRHVSLVFFDLDGRRVLTEKVQVQSSCRQTLDISSLIGRSHGELGTFAVFHSITPPEITNLGSFLAERGYVSYRYRDAPLRAYVHGNLDAIAMGGNGALQLLGGTSWLSREYNLQHGLDPGVVYELVLVNASQVSQLCTFKLMSIEDGKIVRINAVNVLPGGLNLLSIPVNEIGPLRVHIQSHLVMARPLVFRIQNFKMDVFHG